jgi:outer membrane protein OmpA-like peptidoglycan-associated protein
MFMKTKASVVGLLTFCLLVIISTSSTQASTVKSPITHSANTTLSPRSAAVGASILNAATSQSGATYCWDGGTPSGPSHGAAYATQVSEGASDCLNDTTVGYDCTGLTLYAVYQATGIVLSHGPDQATSALDQGGQLISNVSDLQPGDIVYFGGTLSNFLHSGIYAGNGEIWDANVSYSVSGEGVRPDGVHEEPLSWQYAFVGAVRMGPPADGTFVNYQGNVYVIVGGAPLYVSNWAAVGGAQPTTAITAGEWSSLSQYPASGSFVSASGFVFEIVGGAPLYVSNWAAVGGAQPTYQIDPADITNADQGGPWSHLHTYPASGSFVSASGFVFEIVGGAPLYVSNWAAVGGAQPTYPIDPADITNADQGVPWNHLHVYPSNGSFVSASGFVYEIAGGAPLYVSNWATVGGAQPTYQIDPADITNADQSSPWNHLHAVPTNGTFINALSSSGQEEGSYVTAGGTPFYISSWADYGGTQPVVNIDVWDITNIANPTSHLSSAPTNGTLVEGVPSDHYWLFQSGERTSSTASAGAVVVEDSSLASFPIAGSATGTTTTSTTSTTSTTTTTTPKGTTTTTSKSTTTTSSLPYSGATTTTTAMPQSTTTTTPPHIAKSAVVTIAFEVGDSKLRTSAKNDLTRFAKELHPGDSVTVTGYAKNRSMLAWSRAKTVSNYLAKRVDVRIVLKIVTTTIANKTTVKMTTA